MTDVFSFTKGDQPLLISIPHDGRALMPGQAARMTTAGRAIPDTDWFVQELYAFASELGAGVIAANYSRYVVDLNRPADDAALYEGQVSTGLCPTKTFAGLPIYVDAESITATEQHDRVDQYWRPYHGKIISALGDLRDEHGFALLWDAHSIASEVPMLFPGVLMDLNIGTNGGASCGAPCELSVTHVAEASDYSSVLNGRFKGGYITRQYGDPGIDIHAIQLELSQRCYMDENNSIYDAGLAARVGETIRKMLIAFIRAAKDA
jgi:N-formylglutamate deformylase